MRGFAILAVILVHCGFAGPTNYFPNTLKTIIINGDKGVQLFFIISAFTLFHSIDSRSKIENDTTIMFFVRRFFRIVPMFYLAIIYYVIQNSIKVTFFTLLPSVFFIQGLNPSWIVGIVPGSWTIAAEVLFYCLIPILFNRVRTLKQAIFLTIFSLIFSRPLKSS